MPAEAPARPRAAAVEAPDNATSSRNPREYFWLDVLFWMVTDHPRLLRILQRVAEFFVWRFSHPMRQGTLANAARILGPDSTHAARKALGQKVISNFAEFVWDVGR